MKNKYSSFLAACLLLLATSINVFAEEQEMPPAAETIRENVKPDESAAEDISEVEQIEDADPFAPIPEALPVNKLKKDAEKNVAGKKADPKEASVPKPTVSAPVLAQVEARPGVITLSSYIMDTKGIISSSELEGIGSIIGFKEDAFIQSERNIVFASFTEGTVVKPGDIFYVIQKGGVLSHPVTNLPVGFLTETLGVLKALDVKADGVVTAIIDKAYREIMKGSQLIRYKAPIREVALKQSSNTVEGIIIEALERRVSLAADDVVYLDKGKENGLEAGDTMTILRPVSVKGRGGEESRTTSLPLTDLGTLVIIDVNDNTSTALIIDSHQVIYKGDMVTTKPNK